jgi:hypothetical protein
MSACLIFASARPKMVHPRKAGNETMAEDDWCCLKLEAPAIALYRANRIEQLRRNKQVLRLCDFELRNGLSPFQPTK